MREEFATYDPRHNRERGNGQAGAGAEIANSPSRDAGVNVNEVLRSREDVEKAEAHQEEADRPRRLTLNECAVGG